MTDLHVLKHTTVGYSVIPREVACCEVTVNLPSFDDTSSHQDYRDNCFVVDDLTKHPDLQFRNYVTEHPYGRHYAGVPITTPEGVNIGAYCILDDKPRRGISDQDLVFMRDMSQTVMTHLQTIRAISESEQNSQMVTGLGDFVRGTSISLQARDRQQALQEARSPPRHPVRNHEASRNVQRSVPDALIDKYRPPDDHLSKLSGSSNPESHKLCSSHVQVEAKTSSEDTNDEGASQREFPGSPKPDHGVTAQSTARNLDSKHDDKRTYQRAAEIMCQSLNIDGVALLDLSVGVFGGLVKPNEEYVSESSITSESAADEHLRKKTRACRVLGSAQNLPKQPKSGPPAKTLTETFVRRLMHRNPNGKIWSFGEDLTIHSDDAFSSDHDSADDDDRARPQSPGTKERKYARRVRRSDAESLQQAFPGARCIALQGIYDGSRHRWSVAGLYWSYDPLRVLSQENEMQFVSAFCDIMVAETKRVEVYTADKSKSDFLSSVSHELRSPLHGILGSVEILQEEKMDNTVATLVQHIGTCGNSLLEIVDHLLDFANLKKHQVKRGAVKSSKIGRRFLPTAETPESNLAALNTGIALDLLTEDAVSSSVYSYHYHHQGPIRTSVVLDIERSESTDWICKLATGGWKRICTNLVTNALKYTPAGFVHVTLGRRVKPGSRRSFDAVLSIADSGKGMSDDFQKNHLFGDFSQEDTLVSGLGIGMHMVARIINAMGGTIEVTSNQTGAGTRVTVTVPLENTLDLEKPAGDGSAAELRTFAGVNVGVIEVERNTPVSREERLAAIAQALTLTSVESNLKALGMHPEKCPVGRRTVHDLNVVLDVDLATCIRSFHDDTNSRTRTRRAAILVVCSTNPGARALRRAWRENPLSAELTAEFVALPCGLRELTRAIVHVSNKNGRPTKLSTDAESSDSVKVQPITPLSNGISSNQRQASLPMRPLDPPEYSGIAQPKADVMAPAITGAQMPLDQLYFALQELSHFPETRTGSLQDLVSTATLEQRPYEPPAKMLAAQPNPGKPVVLLVDDNNINLQLLVRFAKKQKYEYITATDGKLALEAFENAHRTLSRSASPDAISTVNAPGGGGVPSVILMDINMPVVRFHPSPALTPANGNNRRNPTILLTITD